MNRPIRRIALTVLLAAATAYAQDAPKSLLLTGARVLDPTGRRLLTGRNVLITGEKIQAVLPAASPPPSDAETIDCTGLVLIPGLIDLHTHLLLHPYDEAPWNDQVLTESLELRTIRAVTAARATLNAGFTTIRELGTEGAAYADVALRDAIRQDLIPGPDIIAVTRAIVATGCYGPAGFDPRWSLPKGAQVADGPDALRKVVRSQIAAGADWIKVYADYSRRPGEPATPTFSAEELAAIVAEAKSAQRPVAAHATTPEAIRRAVLAGVHTIEHGTGATAEVLALMRDRGVVLCPTLAASEAMARYAGWQPGSPDHPRITQSRDMFKRALESGVTIACGSDAGVFAHGQNVRELELMVEYGATPVAALRAATTTAARVINKQDRLGRIDAGYRADLVALTADPLADISALRRVAIVIRNGKIAHHANKMGRP